MRSRGLGFNRAINKSQVLGAIDALMAGDTDLLQLSEFILRNTSIWLLPLKGATLKAIRTA